MDTGKKKTFFISGHRDLTQEEFEKHYIPAINTELALRYGCNFVVGDYEGADTMVQQYLLRTHLLFPNSFKLEQVTVYHMGETPNNLISNGFLTKGGFLNDEERDAAMTRDSDADIAFVRVGKRDSGTAQNIVRRYEFND